MKKFEIGQTYSMHSPCMHDCIWTYTVTKRTAQTITITLPDNIPGMVIEPPVLPEVVIPEDFDI